MTMTTTATTVTTVPDQRPAFVSSLRLQTLQNYTMTRKASCGNSHLDAHRNEAIRQAERAESGTVVVVVVVVDIVVQKARKRK